MFTGLIEEIGTIKEKVRTGGGYSITVHASLVTGGLRKGDSVAINGVCQTVVTLTSSSFTVTAVEETLQKTTLGALKAGSKVNLERAMPANGRFGGHFVLGHVDTVGIIEAIKPGATEVLVTVSFPKEFEKYLIPVGSIAIDGISLTVARLEQNTCTVAIIPHTFENTILRDKRPRDEVNLEFDVIGKYVVRSLSVKEPKGITPEWLAGHGFYD